MTDSRKTGINFVSLREGIDLSTISGRLMATVIAGMAQYETEVRQERVTAGIEAAKAAGREWGGSKPGRVIKKNRRAVSRARQLLAEGRGATEVARITKLGRATVYRIKEGAAT